MSDEQAADQPINPADVPVSKIADNPPGTIIRGKGGRFLPGTRSPAPITNANARELQQKRWNAYRKAAAKGITKEAMSIDPSVKTPADAWSLVAAKQYSALMDSDKPRGDDLHRLGQVIGALPLAGEIQAQQAGQAGVTVSVSADTARDLISKLIGNGCDNYTYHKQEDIVDAEAEDVGSKGDG